MSTTTDLRQWAFDPVAEPRLFDQVRRRRMLAFAIDLSAIVAIWVVAAVIVFVLGIITFSLAWGLYAILFPALALLYTAFTLGGAGAATPGMAAMGLTMRLWYGARPDWLIAVMHALLFYASTTLLTPFVLLVSLFSDRKRALHDIVLGVVVVDDRRV
jgi:uncharacterized RDD family membrane protein YckC